MAAMGDSAAPKPWSRGLASDFVWVSSSPTPAEISELEGRFSEVIRIPAAVLEETTSCWKENAVLARTFQRWVPLDAFIREFRRAGISGAIHPISLAHRCHIFRFEDPEMKELVLGRPWVINGQLAAMEAWRPEFVPAMDVVSSALLWVRLPSLPVEFWTEEVLRDILEPAGEFLFVDSATRLLSRGGFARACVRVDLRRPLRPGVRVQGSSAPFWQQFQFENLEGICPRCGSIHLNGPCSLSSSSPASAQPSAGPSFGPWMSVTRRRRPQSSVQRKESTPPGASQNVSVSPSSAAGKTDLMAEGWSSPAKVARRRSSKAGTSSASKVMIPASPPGRLKLGPGPLREGCSDLQGVPVVNCNQGVPVDNCNQAVPVEVTVEAECSEVQKDGSELQIAVFQKPKSNNPFALLDAVNWVGKPSTQLDANPGPSKRARPEESHPQRTSSKSGNRKGKGIGSVEKGSILKDGSGGQSSKVMNCSNESALPCLALAIQSQSAVFALSADGSRASEVTAEAVAQRADVLTMDCTMQSEVDGILPPVHNSDSVMLEDQGGPHPSPQL